MMSLMVFGLSVFTELVVLILVWLLFRTMQVSAEFPQAPAQMTERWKMVNARFLGC